MARTITPPGLTEAHTPDQDAADWERATAGCGTRVVRLRTQRDKELDGLAAVIDYLRAYPDLPLPAFPEISAGAGSAPDGPEIVRQVAEILGEPVEITASGHHRVVKRFGEAAYSVSHVPPSAMAVWDDAFRMVANTQRGAARPESESA